MKLALATVSLIYAANAGYSQNIFEPDWEKLYGNDMTTEAIEDCPDCCVPLPLINTATQFGHEGDICVPLRQLVPPDYVIRRSPYVIINGTKNILTPKSE